MNISKDIREGRPQIEYFYYSFFINKPELYRLYKNLNVDEK